MFCKRYCERQKSRDIPVASLAVKVATEVMHETSHRTTNEPIVLRHTIKSLRKAAFTPHTCDTCKSGDLDHGCRNKYKPYPYTNLSE